MKRLALISLSASVFLSGCSSMTPEERLGWQKFALESATAYRDAKLMPKAQKVEAGK